MKMRTVLDVVASVAMIGASGLIIFTLLAGPRGGQGSGSTQPKTYAVGERFPAVQGLPEGPVVIAWLKSSCRYCEESIPFYRRLVSAGSIPFVAMGRESELALRVYLDQRGLQGAKSLSVPNGELKFYGTPTVAVLDAERKIRGVWLGKLRDSSTEQQVLSLASTLTPKSSTRLGVERHGMSLAQLTLAIAQGR
jgi:hypothetical protein